MFRAVVDTSVLVSAFIGHPGAAPARLVDAWRDGRFVFVVSPQLIDPDPEPATRNPDDDYLVALAREASADMIVSVDRDLLEADLGRVRAVAPGASLEQLVA